MDVKLNYVLIDDEPLTRKYLERVISRLRPGYVMMGGSGSVANIGSLLETSQPDFIISGIRLGDGDSIVEYRRLGCDIPKVLFTAYPERLSDIAGLNVVHSSLKPVPVEDVEASLKRVEARLNCIQVSIDSK